MTQEIDHQARILDRLSQLVECQSVSSNQDADKYHRETTKALGILQAEAEAVGIPFIQTIEHNGRLSLLLGTTDSKTPDVILSGHVDVVDAPDELFHLTRDGDTLKGRGTGDMKGQVAATQEAFLSVPRQAEDPHAPSILFIINGDEEIGSENGAKYIAEELGYRPKLLVICPDGGEPWRMIRSAKGAQHVRFTRRGETAHASRPWEGDNAITPIVEVLGKIAKKYPVPQTENWSAPTVNFGKMAGGQAGNVVAGHAEALLDFRYADPSDLQRFLTYIKRITPPGVEIDYPAAAALFKVDPNNQYLKLFATLIEEATGQKVTEEDEYGATDGRWWNQFGITVAVIAPPSGGHHKDDEWISLSGLVQYYEALNAFLHHPSLRSE